MGSVCELLATVGENQDEGERVCDVKQQDGEALEQVWEKRSEDTGGRRGGGQQGTVGGTQTDREVIGNMFMDDSLWPTRSAGSLEEVARMHETFCDFHKVFIHL